MSEWCDIILHEKIITSQNKFEDILIVHSG